MQPHQQAYALRWDLSTYKNPSAKFMSMASNLSTSSARMPIAGMGVPGVGMFGMPPMGMPPMGIHPMSMPGVGMPMHGMPSPGMHPMQTGAPPAALEASDIDLL